MATPKTKVLLSIRATIFVPSIVGYSDDVWNKYRDLMPNAQREAIPFPGFPYNPTNPIPAENGPWQMLSGKDRLMFGSNRIDFVRTFVEEPTEELENAFIDEAERIFNFIMKENSFYATRIAFNPTFAFDNDNEFSNETFFVQLTTKSEVAGIKISDFAFSFGLSSSWNNGVKLYAAIRFGNGKKEKRQKDGKNDVSVALMTDIDISTKEENKENFNSTDIHLFFQSAVELKNNILKGYNL